MIPVAKYAWIFLLTAITSAIIAQERIYIVQTLDESLGVVDVGSGNYQYAEPLGLYANDVIAHGTSLFVTLSGLNSVQEINAVTNQTARSIPLNGCLNPWTVAVLNEDTIAVSCLMSDNIVLVRLSDEETVFSFDAGTSPEGLIVYGEYLIVCITGVSYPQYPPGYVKFYNRRSLEIIDSVLVGINPQYAAVDPFGRLHVVCTGNYSTESGKIVVIDLDSKEIIANVQTGGTPLSVCFNDETAFVAAGGFGSSGEVYRYRLSDLELLNNTDNPIRTHRGAMDIEITDDNEIYVSCFEDDVIECRSVEGTALETIPVGDGPGWMVRFGGSAENTPTGVTIPRTQRLLTAYPNPFNEGVTLRLNYHYQDQSIINIYNILGEKIASLLLEPGETEVRWNPHSYTETPLTTGTYIAVLARNEHTAPTCLKYIK